MAPLIGGPWNLKLDVQNCSKNDIHWETAKNDGDKKFSTAQNHSGLVDEQIHLPKTRCVQLQLQLGSINQKYAFELDGFSTSISSPRMVNLLDVSSGAPSRDAPVSIFVKTIKSDVLGVRIYDRPDPAKWLSQVGNDVYLQSLLIPGTHESAALYGWPIGKCSDLTITQQLYLGIRFLDLRFGFRKTSLIAYHGIQSMRFSIEQIFEQCYEFLNKNPTETIIVSIKQENRGDGFEDAIYEQVKKSIDMWYVEPRFPTLGEVRGKIVMFSRFGKRAQNGLHPRKWPDNAVEPFEWSLGSTRILTQDWYEIGSILRTPEKCAKVKDLLERSQGENKNNVWHINFTSGSSFITAFPSWVACGIWPLTQGVNKYVMDYLIQRDEQGKPAPNSHVLVMDYVHCPEGLVDLIIALSLKSCST